MKILHMENLFCYNDGMKKVLITGGSEGIGLAFAEEYAKQGCQLYLIARNPAKLNAAKEDLEKRYRTSVRIISCDLSEKGSAAYLFDILKEEDIDVLINNAGFGIEGEAVLIDVEEDEKLIQLNITSLMTLTKLFAGQMKERKEGVILNVASTGAYQPGPYIASYYASKSFVLSYTRAVKEEMKGTGVCIYCVCPGPVATSFYKRSGGTMSHYHMTAGECAVYTLKHMKQNTVIIPGRLNQVLCFLPVSWKMKWVGKVKKK